MSSAESLSRKTGSDSRDRSRTIARVAIRRRATKVMLGEYVIGQVHRNRSTDPVRSRSRAYRDSVGYSRHPGQERNRRRRQGRAAEHHRSVICAKHGTVYRSAHRAGEQRSDPARWEWHLSSAVERSGIGATNHHGADVLLPARHGRRYNGEIPDRPGAAQSAGAFAARCFRVSTAQA